MGLEPMTSPLPRECSTTELHQPLSRQPNCEPPHPLYRALSRASTTLNAKNAISSQVSCWYLPALIVRHTRTARSASTPRATAIRPLLPGSISLASGQAQCLQITERPNQIPDPNNHGAQGRIRTSVTQCVADLQSAAINHSATCALPALRPATQQFTPTRAANLRLESTWVCKGSTAGGND